MSASETGPENEDFTFSPRWVMEVFAVGCLGPVLFSSSLPGCKIMYSPSLTVEDEDFREWMY